MKDDNHYEPAFDAFLREQGCAVVPVVEARRTISGGTEADLITAGIGNDLVRGGDGNDTHDGGWDQDVLRGGNGNDRLLGDLGNDRLFGDAGADHSNFHLTPLKLTMRIS